MAENAQIKVIPAHPHYPGDGGCKGTGCRARWNAVVTHTRSVTEQGPDYCQECSEAICEWVCWPCPAMRLSPASTPEERTR